MCPVISATTGVGLIGRAISAHPFRSIFSREGDAGPRLRNPKIAEGETGRVDGEGTGVEGEEIICDFRASFSTTVTLLPLLR